MGAKENAEVVRRGYEAFQKGDLAAFDDILADDCVWHVPGKSQVAGDKKGRQATVEYYGQLGQLTEGSIQVELQIAITAGKLDDRVHRFPRGGRPYNRGLGAPVQPLRPGRDLRLAVSQRARARSASQRRGSGGIFGGGCSRA